MIGYTDLRWDSQVRAIDGIFKQTLRPIDVVIAIDHNPDLAARFQREVGTKYPSLQVYSFEGGSRGTAGPRNLAVSHSKGELVAFLDDDAYPEATWLEELMKPFANPSVAIVAGHVVPNWMNTKRAPWWFPPEYLWVVGSTWRGFGAESRPVRNAIGASMAVRRSVFDEVGGFDAKVRHYNDDTDIAMRITKEVPGAWVAYAPRSIVLHEVPDARQSIKFFFSRCWTEGIAKGATSERHGRGTLMRELDYCVRYLTTGVLGSLVTLRFGRAFCLIGGFSTTLVGWVYSRVRVARPK
jgi:GT2 family glycosyltransferase